MTRLILLALLLSLHFGAAASPPVDLVVDTHEGQRLRVPTDQPLPPSGQRLVIPARSGMTIHLLDPTLADAEQQFRDNSLLLLTADGHQVLIRDLLGSYEKSPRLFLGKEEFNLEIQRIIAALESGQDVDKLLEGTAAGVSGGGGEVFSMVQVISWFIDRLDVTAEAHADEGIGATPATPAPGNDAVTPVYAQLLAQMQIARDAEIEDHANAYSQIAEELLQQMTERASSGAGSLLELEQARAQQLQARLEVAEAAFTRKLSIDRHQDHYGERLQTSRLPTLTYAASSSMRDDLNRLPIEMQTEGRRYWRQLNFAIKTLQLLHSLADATDKVVDMARRRFMIGQTSFGE
ncbi:MAG: hypothetical protein P8045_03285, partial [Candidatus Thiodiazotropha sp.]